jgi:HTH-type transcriptional regulator, sugar sensing transcriptional regulator
MNREALKSIGLTDNDITLYIALLKEPNSSVTKLRKRTLLANSRIYTSVEKLISKGLATYIVTSHGKMFSAQDPDQILTHAEQQLTAVKSIIPDLKKLKGTAEQHPRSAIFEGIKGFENAFLKMARETPHGAAISIIGFSTQAYKSEQLRRILNRINKQFIAKKHHYRMILDQDNIYAIDREREGITDLRYMASGFVSPAAIDITDESVGIFIWSESPYAIVIDDPHVAKSFQAYFESLWSIAKKKR